MCLRERLLQLDSLPTEILAQVFMHIDLASMRAVRMTCKSCWSVTKTRQFWYYHINKLVKGRNLSLPEDELDNYTVDELENWTFRRSRALDVFFNSEQPRFRKRTLDLRPKGPLGLHPWNFKLIPGGRWLLVSHPSSVVLYFLDLDSVNPTLRLLFDLKEIDDQIHEPKHASLNTWIDRRSSRLSFRIAFRIKAKDLFRTYIIQIDLAGHGENATLVASNIAMLRDFNFDGTVMKATLNDHYLVEVRWLDRAMNTRIGVYNYHLALGCPDYPMNHDKDNIVETTLPTMMEFIFDDILAIQCKMSRNLIIFLVEHPTSLKLLHRIQMHPYNLSTPRWTPRATLITFVETLTRKYQGLIIPHDYSCLPIIFTLGVCDGRLLNLVALGTWILVTWGVPNTVFSRDWDINSPTDLLSTFTNCFQLDLGRNKPLLDEDTGRFLTYQNE